MRMHHVALTVENLNLSISFYEKYFGFEKERSFERSDLGAKACFLKCENMMLELWEFEKSRKLEGEHPIESLSGQGLKHIAFEVDDIKDFRKNLPHELLTTEVQTGASGGKFCFLKDPTGINIELYERA